MNLCIPLARPSIQPHPRRAHSIQPHSRNSLYAHAQKSTTSRLLASIGRVCTPHAVHFVRAGTEKHPVKGLTSASQETARLRRVPSARLKCKRRRSNVHTVPATSIDLPALHNHHHPSGTLKECIVPCLLHGHTYV
jgi:hypothetical protein